MSITSTLSIAAQALKAQQLAIQTTGHNLANVATPGFSRQRADLVSAMPSVEQGFPVGLGVDVRGVQRIVDRFLESELLTLHASVDGSQADSDALARVQEVFPTSGGIDTKLSAFFNALSDLSNNPSGLPERSSVIGTANDLGQSLSQARQTLTSIQQNLDGELQDAASRVNVLLGQIADLNQQIAVTEGRGESANDYRDQRQTLLQELTGLTGATVREEPNGAVNVSLGGLLLVTDNRFGLLHTTSFNAAGFRTITYQAPSGLTFDATSFLTDGKIGALLNARDSQVQDAADRLDQFAKTFVDEFNLQHAAGFDLTGTAGGAFFTPIAATAGAASQVQVAADLAADPKLIAAAAAADGVPGDNRNALALSDVQSTPYPALGGLNLQESYLSLVGDIGSQSQVAQAQLDSQKSLLSQAQARRESVSGVNMDEEMTNLIQFQRAFESASLLVRTADEMYRTLLNMVQ